MIKNYKKTINNLRIDIKIFIEYNRIIKGLLLFEALPILLGML